MMMQELVFVAPNASMRRAMDDYRREHLERGERQIFGGAWLEQVGSFAEWLHLVKMNADIRRVPPHWVQSSTFCVIRKSDGYLVGMADIHHTLNAFLRDAGGHLSYGVRPTQRGRGYGTQILRMSLSYLHQIGVQHALINCARNNVPAVRTIEKNGGRPVSSYRHAAGYSVLRYWMSTSVQPHVQTDAQQTTQLRLADGRQVQLRFVQPSDAEALAKLFKQTERESVYLSREPDELRISVQDAARTIEQVLHDQRRIWLVALAGDELIARCSVNYMQKRERFMHCATLEIELLRAYWNQGVGTMMLDYALGWAVENGYEQAQVCVNANDARTLHVFEKFGFRQIGRVPDACRYPDATYADLVLLFTKLQ